MQSEFEDDLPKVKRGMAELKQLRINLVQLIHEVVALTTNTQDAHFQRVGTELHNFQSVLNQVIGYFNNYLESQQSKWLGLIRTYLSLVRCQTTR